MRVLPIEDVYAALESLSEKHVKQLDRMSESSKYALDMYVQASNKIRNDSIRMSYRAGIFYGISAGIVLGTVITLIATRLFA